MADDQDDEDDGSVLAMVSLYAAIIDVLDEEMPGVGARIQARAFERIKARGGLAADMALALLSRPN